MRSSEEVTTLPEIPLQVPTNKDDAVGREERSSKTKVKRGEQIPTKIGVLMKEGDEGCWKPITQMDLSPQKCSSGPVFASPLKQQNFGGKSHSDQDGVKKDIKIRAATKKNNRQSKKGIQANPKEYMTAGCHFLK